MGDIVLNSNYEINYSRDKKKAFCAADFSLLNLPKGKSLGRSKPATNSYAQALQHTVRDDFYYIQALLNCLLNCISFNPLMRYIKPRTPRPPP